MTGSPLECCRASVVGRPVAGGREQRADRLTFESQFCFFWPIFYATKWTKIEMKQGAECPVWLSYFTSYSCFFPQLISATTKKQMTQNLSNIFRDGWRCQNGWIFGKVPKGGGVIFNPKIYVFLCFMIYDFGPLNRACSEKIVTRVSENEGGKGQRPFGAFPKIHPFWFLFFSRPFDSWHPSLKATSLAKDTHTW